MNVSVVAQYHSEQAMAAARKMRNTRQKQKTGQIVCHHLRMMLSSKPTTIVTALPGSERSPYRQKAQQSQFQLGF